MPHLSSRKIDLKTEKTIFAQLCNTIAKVKQDDVSAFLDALLTETEQLMLSKRLAAIVMFSAGYSTYAVEKTLKISPSTSARLKLAFEIGAYVGVINILDKDKKQRDELWETLEVLLRLGMPSMGKDRWKHLK